MKNKSGLYSYLLCALFAALTAVCSQIMIPLPFTPVPINLAYLAVLVCGGVLGAKKGALAMVVYILLGAVGVPVFVGFNAGLGVLAGPTGGYIVGYVVMPIVCGVLGFGRTEQGKGLGAAFNFLKGLVVVFVGYGFGTVWFMILTGVGFGPAFLMCVAPFIPGDVLKLFAAVAICAALKRAPGVRELA